MTLPVALDTNVLVRLLVNDDPAQAEQAAELIDSSPACFVPITVALELEWVLRGAYKLPREAVITAFEGCSPYAISIWNRKTWCGEPWNGTGKVWTLPMRSISLAARVAKP